MPFCTCRCHRESIVLYQLLQSIHNIKLFCLAIIATHITSTHPSIRCKHFGIGFRIVKIAFHDGCTTQKNLSFFVRSQFFILLLITPPDLTTLCFTYHCLAHPLSCIQYWDREYQLILQVQSMTLKLPKRTSTYQDDPQMVFV